MSYVHHTPWGRVEYMLCPPSRHYSYQSVFVSLKCILKNMSFHSHSHPHSVLNPRAFPVKLYLTRERKKNTEEREDKKERKR